MSVDLKWTTNTRVTPFTLTSKAYLKISMVLEHLFCSFIFLPVHPYFYPSTKVFTHLNDGWTGLCIKLCFQLPSSNQLGPSPHIPGVDTHQIQIFLGRPMGAVPSTSDFVQPFYPVHITLRLYMPLSPQPASSSHRANVSTPSPLPCATLGCLSLSDMLHTRALCRTKLLPVTHVLVDTWMLTVKQVYQFLNVSDDLEWTTNTRDTIFTHFQGIPNNIYGFGRPFFAPSFVYPSTTHPPIFLPVHIHFYPSK